MIAIGDAGRVTDFVIRDAVLGDMGALQGVFRAASLSDGGYREILLAHPEVLELQDQAVREGRTRAAVAEGGIVGFASWLDAGEAVEVEDLFVDPDWMRHGIGRALMMDLIAIARGRGTGLVEVTANHHALAFYGKVGFAVIGEVETRFGPAPRMRLEVPPEPL
jgi:GNAT superfamily N-acetyltransferase